MEVVMSEQSEKLVKIILPDLLNYLEMVESGEIIERRLKKNTSLIQREDKCVKTFQNDKVLNNVQE